LLSWQLHSSWVEHPSSAVDWQELWKQLQPTVSRLQHFLLQTVQPIFPIQKRKEEKSEFEIFC
jgi:hypothetical protein